MALSSARADEIDALGAVEFDAETLLAVTNLARSVAGVNATSATVEDNVASILTLLNHVIANRSGMYKVITLPQYEAGGNTGSLGALLAHFMYDGANLSWPPDISKSYLYMIERAIYGQSGIPSQSQSLLPVLWRMEGKMGESYTNQLSAILGSLNALEYMGQNVTGWEAYWTNELVPMHAIMDAVRSTEYTNAWNVALVYDQWVDIRDYLQGIAGATGDTAANVVQGLTIAGETNTTLQASIAGDLDALRRGLLTETDYLSDVEVHVDAVEEYVDDDIETNALAAFTISPGDAGDLSPVLDLVDPDAFDVLPTLTGGDPVVQVFTARRDSNLPAFSIDFSLPSGFRTFVHAVCVWIWRMLFFLAMWRLVNEEFGYWSTLGGSAG